MPTSSIQLTVFFLEAKKTLNFRAVKMLRVSLYSLSTGDWNEESEALSRLGPGGKKGNMADVFIAYATVPGFKLATSSWD